MQLDINIQEHLNLMAEVAKKAASMAQVTAYAEVINDLDRDVKVDADLRINEFVVNALCKHMSHPVLSEEGGTTETSRADGYYFIVDPLDGSLNYSRSIPICCISIAFWKGMEPLAGVVYDFTHDDLYSGAIGLGAYLNGNPIRGSQVMKKKDAILCTGFPVKTDFSEKALMSFIKDVQDFKKIRLLGSAAMSLVYVATGRADAYYEKAIALWDVAAGIAINIAAGGAVSFSHAKEINRLDVMASNNLLQL